MSKRVLLMILDGWGISPDPKVSAVAQANTPFVDRLSQNAVHNVLHTDGMDVGLPEGQMGNSEVGHVNLGAGRVVYQDLAKINMAVEQNTLKDEAVLKDAFAYAKTNNKAVHFLGLVSDGGVHAHINHLEGLIKVAHEAQVPKTYVHAFTDGRDVLPRDAGISLQNFVADLPNNASIGSLTGRYFGMDRDHRWDRTQKAYDAIARGRAEHHTDDAIQALQTGYVRGESDEFLSATIIGDYAGMRDGDGLVMMNFRADRARQLLDCLYRPEVTSCDTRPIALCPGLGMTSYSATS